MFARVLLTIVTLPVLAVVATACGSHAPGPQAGPSSSAAFADLLAESGAAVPARGKSIVVNIPAFELIAVDDGRPVLRSRVIVGTAATPTPELLSPLYAVRFNPSWTPTPAMVRKEGARPMPPGPHNPLGQILFELDNDEQIYLHDTNDRSLFDRADRALSHGCVRVQRARALAAWALGKSEDDVARMIAAGATRSVPLPSPIPVLLAYHTRFPDRNGAMKTYPDVYGRGQIAHLNRGTEQRALPAGCRSPV